MRINDQDCECVNWTRADVIIWSKHHPKCPQYNEKDNVFERLRNLDSLQRKAHKDAANSKLQFPKNWYVDLI